MAVREIYGDEKKENTSSLGVEVSVTFAEPISRNFYPHSDIYFH